MNIILRILDWCYQKVLAKEGIIYCGHCLGAIDKTSNFCPYCGTSIEKMNFPNDN